MAKQKRSKRVSKRNKPQASTELLWNKDNYILIIVGFVVILVGLLLMFGGAMDSPDEWDASKIYSFRRVTLAPVVILIGLVIQIYAIFKKKDSDM